MKIFVDENIPRMTVNSLRGMNHDVLDIRGTTNEGMTDDAIWKMIQQERRLLITTDKGFTQYRNKQHYGILIVCLRQPNRRKIHQRVMQAINKFSAEKWRGLLVVVRDLVQSVWQAN